MSFVRSPTAYLLAPDQCPIVNTSVRTLKADLLKLCQDRARLHDLGVRGRRYVEEHFSIDVFSRRLAGAYKELEIE